MKTKRVCPTCHTTKFRKTSDSGLVCKYGHKVLGVQAEQAEDDYTGSRGKKRKSVKQLRDEPIEATPAQQASQFLLITQYALQVISRSMVQDLNFPPELEPTVRELWLLYVSDSKKEVSDAYMFEAFEREANDNMKGRRSSYDIKTLEQEEELLERARNKDEDTSDSDDEDQQNAKSRNVRFKWPALQYHHTLSFIYLACIYLKYPILPNDLVRWCRTSDIPYLAMQERIPPSILIPMSLALSNTMLHVPSPVVIRKAAHIFKQCFLHNCKLTFPELNVPLYIDRFCAQFLLPVEGYYYAKHIFETYRQIHVLELQDLKSLKYAPATAYIMASVLITVKILYAIGDNLSDTLKSVSEFDTTTTKAEYMNKIRENIKQWKKVYEQQDDLGNIIQTIKKTSVASKISMTINQRNIVMLNALISNYRDRTLEPSSSSNLFMDTTVWDKDQKITEKIHTHIRKGAHYFTRKTAPSPKDYLDILELATLITGVMSNTTLEVALQAMEVAVLRHDKLGSKCTTIATVNKVFGSTIP